MLDEIMPLLHAKSAIDEVVADLDKFENKYFEGRKGEPHLRNYIQDVRKEINKKKKTIDYKIKKYWDKSRKLRYG